jgi:cytochrome b pre-mRNA-processing protein 3
MGVGDLTVPKRMQKFGAAFYGRTAAYDAAMEQGAEPLSQALCKNILNGRDIASARRLAAYVNAALAALAALDDKTVANGAWRFASPTPFAPMLAADQAP